MSKFPELSEHEKELFDAVLTKTLDDVKRLVKEEDVRINCLDEHGSTPLQQAAFKGNIEVCKCLLDLGADVNSNEHEHGYTALMFAALSGNAELCRLFLKLGARTDRRNKVGRTATEMAAFTGQHHCVSVINNYLNENDVEYYSKPHGSETEGRIPSHLAHVLHQLTLTYNVHPIKTILFMCENIELLNYEKQVLYVLEDLMERQMKSKETNEVCNVMAFKIHIIYSTFKAAFKYINERKEDESKSNKDKLISYAKNLLLLKDNNFPKTLELFTRQCIKEFPYRHSVILQQMVSTLSKTPVGSSPTAVSCVNSVLVGQRMMSDELFCCCCGESRAQKRCSACKMVNYCSAECQKLHWFTHKTFCKDLANEYKDLLELQHKHREEEKQRREEEERQKAEEAKHEMDQNVEAESKGETASPKLNSEKETVDVVEQSDKAVLHEIQDTN